MTTQMFLNVPVKDLERSKAFFARLGYKFDAQFSNEQGACMIVDQNIFVMLLVEAFFQTFIKKTICDARTSTEAIICLSMDSRAKVDEIVRDALAAGAAATREAKDHGFMYEHGFEDLDGHLWEFVYMEPQAAAH